MTDVEFDEVVELSLAQFAAGEESPGPEAKVRLLAAIGEPPVPAGFSIRRAAEQDWMPHPVPGIRMKILALNKARGYATLLLDVRPGTRFPAHHHGGAEECYVVSGSLVTCGRRLGPGDFVHADGETDHGDLFTDEGCQVVLVVPPEEHLPDALLR
jgi:anti-sigma factor ChrR (cupin superfamily)